MKVTQRLPPHGAFAGCEGLVEMRYFRFQGGESKVAAVLFGVLEEANLPQSKRLRKKLTQVKDRSQDTDRRLLEFVDPLISQEVLLSMWNYDRGFYVHLKRIFRDFFGRMSTSDAELLECLQRELNLELVNYRDLSSARPGNMSIIWGETGDGAVLLYRHYAASSIVITPCKHSFIKWRMFGYMRQTMGKPETIDESRQKGFMCNCGTDITDLAFNRGKEDAKSLIADTGLEIYRDILNGSWDFVKYRRSTNTNRCCCCDKTEGVRICGNHHRMCMTCLAGNTITRFQFRCLLCQETILPSLQEEVLSLVPEVVNVPREDIKLMCEGCQIECHFSEFIDNSGNSHRCLICRECRQRLDNRCPSCEEFIFKSSTALRTTSTQPSTGLLRCEGCNYVKAIIAFGAYLLTAHKCIVCDACVANSTFHGPGRCPKCDVMSIFTDDRNRGNVESSLIVCCQSCHSRKEVSEFSIYSRLSHWFKCRVCNFCLKSKLAKQPPDNCSVCTFNYLQGDMKILFERRQAVLEEEKKSQTDSRAPMGDALRCVKCGKQQEHRNFAISYELQHSCFVCDRCFAVHPPNSRDIWSTTQYCPHCRHTFDCKGSLVISEGVRKLEVPAVEETYRCELCKTQKPKYQITKCLTLTHSCKICDECLARPIKSRRCQVCEYSLSEGDLTRLGRAPSGKPCSCGNAIATIATWQCPNKCVCSLCIIKHCWLSNQQRCPKCSAAVTGYSLISPTCSHCHRRLNDMSSDITRRVAGICSKMHVLCCFCIQASYYTSSCKVCFWSVELKSLDLVESAQRNFRLACFCGEPSEGRKLVRLKCGLCKTEFRKPPPSKSLPEFLQ